MTTFTTDQWIILGLVFLLGLLVGSWLTSGGRAKWKKRYNDEVAARKALEAKDKEREAHWATREKEWREDTDRRHAALRSAPPIAPAAHDEPYVEDRVRDRHPTNVSTPRRDLDRDGVPDQYDRRPLDDGRR
jgi:hypothetical protein